MKSMLPTALLATALATPALLHAQDAPPPVPPAWSGQAEVSYVSTTGNTSTSTLGAAAQVDYKPSPWVLGAKISFVRAEADGDEKARALAFQLHAGQKLDRRLEVFAQADYLQNRFAGIENRYSVEGGLSYMLLESGPQSLKTNVSIGYAKESRITGDDLSFAFAKAGLKYKYAFSKTSDFTDEVMFTEDLKETGDWRLGNVASLTASLSTLFSLKASHTFSYVNHPPATFGKTDTITSVALVAKF
jgi:putative salt-induced outer membrane protein